MILNSFSITSSTGNKSAKTKMKIMIAILAVSGSKSKPLNIAQSIHWNLKKGLPAVHNLDAKFYLQLHP